MTSKRVKILITNDDGISSQGMKHLVSSLLEADFADLYIVAPKEEQSGKGMSFSYAHPVAIEDFDYPLPVQRAWCVDGTPVDCVKLAVGYLFCDSPIDLVLSGINHGSNAGRNIFYSGTAGAAMEAVLSGIPAVALSQDQHISFFQEENAANIIHALALYALSTPFSELLGSTAVGFNVNFPSLSHTSWKGLRLVITGDEFACGIPKLLRNDGKAQHFSLRDCCTVRNGCVSAEYRILKEHFIAVAPLFVSNSPFSLISELEFQNIQDCFNSFISQRIPNF